MGVELVVVVAGERKDQKGGEEGGRKELGGVKKREGLVFMIHFMYQIQFMKNRKKRIGNYFMRVRSKIFPK